METESLPTKIFIQFCRGKHEEYLYIFILLKIFFTSIYNRKRVNKDMVLNYY
jgi:hypothetical protein